MLNHFNIKFYYFLHFYQSAKKNKKKKTLHITAQAPYFTKIQIQIFFSHTQLT